VVVKFRMTGSKLNKNKIRKRYVLTAAIFDHNGPRKVTSPSKSLHQLAVRSWVLKSCLPRNKTENYDYIQIMEGWARQNTTEFFTKFIYDDEMFRPLWAILRSQNHKENYM